MNRSKQGDMTVKTIVVLLVGLALASGYLAEAQQPKKISRVGFLAGSSGGGKATFPVCAKVFENSVTSRVKTSP